MSDGGFSTAQPPVLQDGVVVTEPMNEKAVQAACCVMVTASSYHAS